MMLSISEAKDIFHVCVIIKLIVKGNLILRIRSKRGCPVLRADMKNGLLRSWVMLLTRATGGLSQKAGQRVPVCVRSPMQERHRWGRV